MLKVGELARSSGLTVRTLHHYDEIGLLKPSGRSESGYRLYSGDDIARLHGIQALRQLGLALNDIAALLDDARTAPAMILQQQVNALDRQIAQATELRARLALIQGGLDAGHAPPTEDWLQALALMATYGKYFSTAELKQIFDGWHRIEHEWPRLLDEVRALMDTGASPLAREAQVLARRWMSLVHHWMDGNFELMQRWGEMYKSEPSAHGRRGGPPSDMLAFMEQATGHRLELLKRHFDLEELRRFRYVPEQEYRALNEAGLKLLQQGERAGGAAAQALAKQWLALLDRVVGGDAALCRKLIAMQHNEPLLQAGSPLVAEVREWLLQTLEGLDPHAT